MEEIKITKTEITNYVYFTVVQTDDKEGINPTGKNFTNQTGNFPLLSSQSYQYLLVLY